MYTPDNITELKENEIFVFGSNKLGNHAGGAARTAVEKFGAVMGQVEGLRGQSYAIPTLDENMERVDEDDLLASLRCLSNFAQSNKDKTFYLTKIGCGIAGFDTNEIAYLVLKAKFPDNVIIPEEFRKIHGYKAFNEDLTCRDIQYEVGKTYTQDGKIKVCENGLHFCVNPMNILQYYTPSNNGKRTRFCEVEADGEMDVNDDDTKIAASSLKIKAELDVPGLCKAAFEYVKSRCKKSKAATAGNYGAAMAGDSGAATAGNYGAATAGNYGAATAGDSGAATAGNYGAATAGDSGAATAGDRGAATAGYSGAATAGDRGAATAGNYGAATAGDRGAATAGNYGAATAGYSGAATAGNYGAATAGYSGAATAGNYGAATAGDSGAATAGNYGAATAGYSGAATAGNYGAATSRGKSSSGKNGLSVARGNNVKVRGGIGAILVIAEENTDSYDIKDWKAVVVDGEKVKADTWYRLEDGKLVEVDK